MARKRNAATELTQENWDDEEEPEDAGTFAPATKEELEKRQVRTARRRLLAHGESTGSAFKGFSGFKVSSAAATSAFSFLKSNAPSAVSQSQTNLSTASSIFSKIMPSTNGLSKPPENGVTSSIISSTIKVVESKSEEPKESTHKIFESSSEYFSKLKGLNESVSKWIKTHVDSNPFCILTPIFRDYERYLKEIESQYGQQASASTNSGKTAVSTASTSSNTAIKPSVGLDNPSKTLNSDSKPSMPSAPSIFGNSSTTTKGIFSGNSGENPFLKSGTAESNNKNEETKLENKSLTFPQSSGGTAAPATFRFGASNSSTNSSGGFSFGGGNAKPFSFGNSVVTSQESQESSKVDEEKNDDEDEPPKVEVKPITEEGAIYEKRCKVFFKKDQGFSDRGVGVLFLKPTTTGKTQLIVRAETSLGNLLINTLLTESVPITRANKNTVMIICAPLPNTPQPPLTSVFLRVKTSEDADGLLQALKSNKK